eukprot:gene28297-34166_t
MGYSVVVKDENGSESSERCDNNNLVCVNFPGPVVHSIEPASGPTHGGFNISLSGEFLGWNDFPLVSVVKVFLRDRLLQVVENSLTRLVVQIPPGEGRHLSIYATYSDSANIQQFGVKQFLFSYNEPTMYSASALSNGTRHTLLFEGCSLLVNGLNFGDRPMFRLNGVELDLIWHNQSSAILVGIPSGQGLNNLLTVLVGQQSSSGSLSLSYEAPFISSISRRESSIFGDNDLITLVGGNFGSINRKSEIEIFLGPFVVKENITLLNSSTLVFKPPRGIGSGLNVSINVSGILSMQFAANFAFLEPSLSKIETVIDASTGRGVLAISGVRLGATLTVPLSVYIRNNESCLNFSDHETRRSALILPREHIIHFPLVFNAPVLTSLYLEREGDASGNELIEFRGSNFGGLPPQDVQLFALNNISSYPLCAQGNSWMWSSNRRDKGPVINCKTNPLPVGFYNVHAFIGGVKSTDFNDIEFICRRGSYGSPGQYCSSCDSMVSGWTCENDNMTQPVSLRGWYLFEGNCVKQLPKACLSVYPCAPKEACLGNNTCLFPYTGPGCFHCSLGHFRINSQCKSCAISYVAAFVLLIVTAALTMSYILSKADSEFFYRIYLFIDFLQTLALTSSINGMLSSDYSLLSSTLSVMTVFYANWELWNVNCWGLFKPFLRSPSLSTFPISLPFNNFLPSRKIVTFYKPVNLYKVCL